MLTQTARQAPVKELKVCVGELTEDEIRTAIAYMLVKTNKKEQQTQTSLVLSNPSPRLVEMMIWIDMMNDSSRDKLSLYLMKKLVPQPSRIREGRYKGTLNR